MEVHHTIAEIMIFANVEVAAWINKAFPMQVLQLSRPHPRRPATYQPVLSLMHLLPCVASLLALI